MAAEKKVTETTPELGDETFMSASELRSYMSEVEMASASKDDSTCGR